LIELADDDQQKEFVQLGQGPLQRSEVVGRGFKTGQGHGQRRHLTALFFQQFALLLVQDSLKQEEPPRLIRSPGWPAA
jgi:hypothetical protein